MHSRIHLHCKNYLAHYWTFWQDHTIFCDLKLPTVCCFPTSKRCIPIWIFELWSEKTCCISWLSSQPQMQLFRRFTFSSFWCNRGRKWKLWKNGSTWHPFHFVNLWRSPIPRGQIDSFVPEYKRLCHEFSSSPLVIHIIQLMRWILFNANY